MSLKEIDLMEVKSWVIFYIDWIWKMKIESEIELGVISIGSFHAMTSE